MSNDLQALRIETLSGGKASIYEVPGRVVLVGSGSHCDVRLAPDECAGEQLRIELREDELWGRSLAPERECRLGGLRFVEGPLAPGSEVAIGSTVLRVQRSSGPSGRRSKKSSEGGLPPALRVLGFAGLALGFYLVSQEPEQVSLLQRTVEPPALFAEPTEACVASGEDEAEFHARRCLREAILKRERAPFYAKHGVRAVLLYEQASACFERAGEAAKATSAERAAARLRRTLEDEFHVRQVRLERFLDTEKYDRAQREVRVLQDFLHQQDSAYARWLSGVQRELNTRFATAEKDKG